MLIEIAKMVDEIINSKTMSKEIKLDRLHELSNCMASLASYVIEQINLFTDEETNENS